MNEATTTNKNHYLYLFNTINLHNTFLFLRERERERERELSNRHLQYIKHPLRQARAPAGGGVLYYNHTTIKLHPAY